MSGVAKRERATIGLVSLGWAVVSVSYGAWFVIIYNKWKKLERPQMCEDLTSPKRKY